MASEAGYGHWWRGGRGGAPVLHEEKLGAGEVAMGGAAGNGVGVERGAHESEDRERDHGVRTGGDKVQGLLPCVW